MPFKKTPSTLKCFGIIAPKYCLSSNFNADEYIENFNSYDSADRINFIFINSDTDSNDKKQILQDSKAIAKKTRKTLVLSNKLHKYSTELHEVCNYFFYEQIKKLVFNENLDIYYIDEFGKMHIFIPKDCCTEDTLDIITIFTASDQELDYYSDDWWYTEYNPDYDPKNQILKVKIYTDILKEYIKLLDTVNSDDEQRKEIKNYMIKHAVDAAISYVDNTRDSDDLLFLDKDAFTEQEKNSLRHIESTATLPKSHIIPNNKLANAMTGHDLIDNGLIDLSVHKTKNKEITAQCVLSYEGSEKNIEFRGKHKFTEYDRNVYNAIVSLYRGETNIITSAMVYRAMTNKTETETPSEQQINLVTNSIEKMRFIKTIIDCSEELKARNLALDGEQIKEGYVDTYLLTLKSEKVMVGNKILTAYKILDIPILYEYSRMLGQVISYKQEYLTMHEYDEKNHKLLDSKVADTESRIMIKGYLIRRIEVMKGATAQKQSRIIKYDYIFDDILNINENTANPAKERQRTREYIITVLQNMKCRGEISDFSEIKNGRKFEGIEIVLK